VAKKLSRAVGLLHTSASIVSAINHGWCVPASHNAQKASYTYHCTERLHAKKAFPGIWSNGNSTSEAVAIESTERTERECERLTRARWHAHVLRGPVGAPKCANGTARGHALFPKAQQGVMRDSHETRVSYFLAHVRATSSHAGEFVLEQEYAYFIASTSARPLAPPVRPCLGANGTMPEWDGAQAPSQWLPDSAADSELALPFSVTVSGSDRTGTCPAKQDRLLPLRDSTAAARLVARWRRCAIQCCEGTCQPCPQAAERGSFPSQGPAWAWALRSHGTATRSTAT
jgi:hypothetical protein